MQEIIYVISLKMLILLEFSRCFWFVLLMKVSIIKRIVYEHVYMRPKVNSNRLEMLFRLHGNLHIDFTAASFQTIARPYCTCANDIF